jgi:hypothetical protein
MEMEFSMAHVWFCGDDDTWSAMPLGGHAVDVSVFPPVTLGENFQLGEDAQAALVRTGGDSPSWVLVVAPGGNARVNGFAPVAGVRALQDRDEVRAAASAPLFFSTETLARVEEFPGSERAVYCGRCRQAMEKGQLAVRCPQCGVWYHQSEQFPCWLYAPKCAFCPRSTALDAAFAWVPEA